MATRLPTVRVTRTTAGGYRVTCTACTHRRLWVSRNQADADAHYHRADHARTTS